MANSTREPFYKSMQPASFGGVSFFTVASRLKFGRRNALHEYPFRETVWVEDLGRQGRRIQMSGFLVGDDVGDQLRTLMDAAESVTPSELVHPLLGRRQVALMEAEAGDSLESGRVVELSLLFIEQGQRQYPSAAASSTSNTGAQAAATAGAASSSWTAQGGPALTGPASNGALANVSSSFGGQAILAGQNATALVLMSAVLLAAVGSRARRGTGIKAGQAVVGAPADVQGLIGLAALGRQNIDSAADALTNLAATVQPENAADYALAVIALAEALRASAATPGDGVRALIDLASFSDDITESGDALTVHQAALALMQRAAAASMVRAAAAYQCETSDEAVALRDKIVGVLDVLIDDAGDSGDDTSYQSLRTMRATIVAQLNAEGAALPQLVPFTLPDTLPSLALAQRLYRDAGRADELVYRANAIHPAFIPPGTFKVLNQ